MSRNLIYHRIKQLDFFLSIFEAEEASDLRGDYSIAFTGQAISVCASAHRLRDSLPGLFL